MKYRYDGPPLDPNYPPHCFQIFTADTNYYVGENLDWYNKQGKQTPGVENLPRRDSGAQRQ